MDLLALVPAGSIAHLADVPTSAPSGDPRPLEYVLATVIGALVVWVLYTLTTAETRKAPPQSPAKLAAAKDGDDLPK